jgi:predicted RNA-binding Zn-ribbon protein involved in translation (DUF1610 family)
MSDSQLKLIVASLGGIVFVVFVTLSLKKKGMGEGTKMGINSATNLKCPNCGSPVPTIRRPKNFRQAMWGGFTCSGCGREFDKWLKPISSEK